MQNKKLTHKNMRISKNYTFLIKNHGTAKYFLELRNRAALSPSEATERISRIL
jgi:hypothetical protein